ncbi:hypothetical protein [Georgenia sp. AZ-5]|uniref:hypothetical protein n=1 Tax=Georgenia sp. AZ-5 TaxID=3367526 RepID=UPI003754CC14
MPNKDGKDYSDWQRYADTSLADRCRADFDRYGVCSILYELTPYDGNFKTGELPLRVRGLQADAHQAPGSRRGHTAGRSRA